MKSASKPCRVLAAQARATAALSDWRGISLGLVLVTMTAASARAQEQRVAPGAYLTGSFVVTATDARTPLGGPFGPTQGPSGISPGAGGSLGLHVLPRLAVEGEFQFPWRIARESTSPNSTPPRMSHRDVTAMVLLRTRFRPNARVQPGFTIGTGLVRAYTRQRFVVLQRPPEPPTSFETDWQIDNEWGFTAGMDAHVPLGPQLVLTPEVRLFGASRSSGVKASGVASWFVRTGVGLQWVFTSPPRAPVGPIAQRIATSTPRAFVGGGFIASFQNEGEMRGGSQAIASRGTGGTAIGGATSFGAFVRRWVSVEAEVTMPTFFSVTRRAGRFIYHDRHRDIIVSGLVRIHDTRNRRVAPEAVVGLSYVREDTYESTQFLSFTTPPTWSAPSREEARPSNALGWTSGLDFPIRLTDRAEFVPGLRVHIVPRDRRNNSTDLGLGLFVVRPTVGIRWAF